MRVAFKEYSVAPLTFAQGTLNAQNGTDTSGGRAGYGDGDEERQQQDNPLNGLADHQCVPGGLVFGSLRFEAVSD